MNTISKHLLPLLLALSLLLIGTGCSSGEKQPAPTTPSSHQLPASLSPEEQTSLTETAQLLTEVLCRYTTGFPRDEASPRTLNQPTQPRQPGEPTPIPSFVMLLAYYQGSGYPGALYAGDFTRDEEGIFHLSADAIPRAVEEVLGVTDFVPGSNFLEYREAEQEYCSGMEFGLGGSWACGDIAAVRFTGEESGVEVDFTAQSLFPYAAGYTPEEVTAWSCRASYAVRRRQDGTPFLRLEEMVILDRAPEEAASDAP